MNRLNIEIRPGHFEDIEDVLALWVRADTEPSPTDNPAALRKRMERDPELFLVATDGSKLVASLIGGWDGWKGNMYRLAVDPQYRRMGLALRLVGDVETRLREVGAERITSLVLNEEGAVAF